MSEFLSVYVTAASKGEAEKIARFVIEEKLAACANILPEVQSIYRWQGKIEQAQECAMILKTKTEKFDDLRKRIKGLHSYDCPCIVAWPIVAGDEAYLKWIENSL